MRIRVIAAVTTISLATLAPSLSFGAGLQPYAFVSIAAGSDFPGCGTKENPCRTARYAYDCVVRPDGPIYVDDVGRFGEPTIFTTFSIILDAARSDLR